MDRFMTWLFLSFVVEKLSEYTGKLVPVIERLENEYVNTKLFIAFGFSLLFTFGANLDFFKAFEIEFTFPVVGIILTAVFLSGGSNAVHDLLSVVANVKTALKPAETYDNLNITFNPEANVQPEPEKPSE